MRILTGRMAIGALGVCLMASLGARCGSAPVLQDDVDGDGFVASIDNCTTRANANQLDSDHDGAGDACDADYDQNGRVGVSDFSRFRSAFGLAKGAKGFDPRYDHNGDGRIGLPDFNLLRASYGRAPGPFADDDADGVPVAMDLCPGGLSGEPAIGHGCSVFDVAARPNSVLTPLIEGLDALEAEIGSVPSLTRYGVVGYLGNASSVLDSALAIAARANPCGGYTRALGGPTAGGADASLSGAIAMIDAAQQDLIDAGPPGRGSIYGDTSEWDAEVSGLDYWRRRVEQKRASLGDALVLLDTACQETTSFTTYRGVVRRFDAAERRIELDNGRVFAMADGFNLVAVSPIGGYNDLSEGDEARFSGIYAGDGGVAVTAEPVRVPVVQPDVPDTFACLRTRFAPFQRFTVPPNQQELHEPIAYFADGRYRLEKGMRVGAESFCTIPVGQQQWLRFSMEVRFTASGGQPQVLAADYYPGLQPVPLPPSSQGTITVVIHTRDCNGNYGFPNSYNCGPKEEQSSTDYPFVQRPHWNNCYVTYGRGSDRTYTVDDQAGTDFEAEQLISLHLAGDMYYDSGTVPEFEAEGYATTANSPSSFPATAIRGIGDWFAIHNGDFYPVHGAATDAEELALIESQGIRHAAGLRWPRIRGTLNGRTFAYSCHVPPIVRDALDLCPNRDDHAFYRLPFPEGDTSWSQGQGNDGSFTHSGGFAYDMIAPLGETILVARSGRVVGKQDSEYRQCCNGCDVESSPGNPCPRGNYLWVEHQDGSIGQYVHMPQNGVDPDEGDIVRRGDRVGEVGVTGNTTGPHLHFAARDGIPGSGLPTRLALFEALDPDDLSEVLTCYEPPNIESGPTEPLRSTNEPR